MGGSIGVFKSSTVADRSNVIVSKKGVSPAKAKKKKRKKKKDLFTSFSIVIYFLFLTESTEIFFQ